MIQSAEAILSTFNKFCTVFCDVNNFNSSDIKREASLMKIKDENVLSDIMFLLNENNIDTVYDIDFLKGNGNIIALTSAKEQKLSIMRRSWLSNNGNPIALCLIDEDSFSLDVSRYETFKTFADNLNKIKIILFNLFRFNKQPIGSFYEFYDNEYVIGEYISSFLTLSLADGFGYFKVLEKLNKTEDINESNYEDYLMVFSNLIINGEFSISELHDMISEFNDSCTLIIRREVGFNYYDSLPHIVLDSSSKPLKRACDYLEKFIDIIMLINYRGKKII